MGRTFRVRDAMGHLVSADTHESALNHGHALFVFNPADPFQGVRIFEVSAGADSKRSLLVWHQGEVFFRRGSEIHRWKPGAKASRLWYQADRSFVSFQVVDESTVLLAGTAPRTVDPKTFLFEPMDPEALKKEEVLLLESVDVKSGLRNARLPFPETIQKLEETFQPFPLYDLWLMRSGDAFLCLLPTLGHAYAYKPEMGRLQELETPWPWLDVETFRPHLAKASGGPVRTLNPFGPFFLGMPSISPGIDRRLYLTYRQYPVSHRTLEYFWNLAKVPGDQAVVLPRKAKPVVDLPGSEEPSPFRVAIWKEGASGFEAVQCAGPLDLEKAIDLKLSGRLDAFFRQGIFINHQEEPRALQELLDAMRKQVKPVQVPGLAAKPTESARAQGR